MRASTFGKPPLKRALASIALTVALALIAYVALSSSQPGDPDELLPTPAANALPTGASRAPALASMDAVASGRKQARRVSGS